MSPAVAIVGMACRYPDAGTPEALLENSLAQRQSFRVIPDSRLAPAGYFDESGLNPDRAYARQAAVLDGFHFDRAWFRVSRDSYEVTDVTHWLALTVAREAVEDIRFRAAARHPDGDNVRVVVGNTLTGEFARAGLMRLRWPYVEKVVAQELGRAGLLPGEASARRFMAELETNYKAPFPVPNEDLLAGGLANTIAGRICNHFDFRGGGYTVDGACSSSLLAVTDACSALAAGDADMVLAGGVDLSLDPFELVGFSRSAALARHEMLVYDEGSEGFWPGEGCGFVALMRHEDAVDQCERIYGVIRGWGISSDGRGGLTRPEADGQLLAIQRCYRRAGYGVETVGYFEGHGTGTRVGDAAELSALIGARSVASFPLEPAVISSVKANIGHTKAAAGIAGLLRATMCVGAGVRPPATACREPHRLLAANAAQLRVAREAEDWPAGGAIRRAGVSAAGFGGINTHVTVEEAAAGTREGGTATGRADVNRFAGAQDAELLLFGASRREDLAWTVAHVAAFAARLSRAELTDLAVELAHRATRGASYPWKAAVAASTPAEFDGRLALLRDALEAFDGRRAHLDSANGVFLSSGGGRGKVGLVFSGQGSPVRAGGGAHARRFREVGDTYREAGLAACTLRDGTDFAQPAIVTASLAGLRLLERIGAAGDVALGHSLGELAALHWAGHFDAGTLLCVARARGRAMAAHGAGAMAAVAAGSEATRAALGGRSGVHLANFNGPRQTVVSGDRDAVEALVARLRETGTTATVLDVGHAFHTPMMAGAAEDFVGALEGTVFGPGGRPVVSSVTGDWLPPATAIVPHLRDQCVSPVRFEAAATRAASHVDLLLEVGPGRVLAGLLGALSPVPVLPLDIGGESLKPFLAAAGAAFVIGAAPLIGRLYDDRFARRFNWSWSPRFLANPCEAPPATPAPPAPAAPEDSRRGAGEPPAGSSTLERLRQSIAQRTGLPAWTIEDSSRMLSELHLNSITVGEIVGSLVQSVGLASSLVDPTEYADASVFAIAEAIDGLAAIGAEALAGESGAPDGIGPWVRSYRVARRAAPAAVPGGELRAGVWEGFGPGREGADWLVRHLEARPSASGVVVWTGSAPGPPSVEPLLCAARRAAALAAHDRGRVLFVVVQPGWGGGGFARSWFLETGVDTLVVNVDPGTPDDAAALVAEEIRRRHPDADPARSAAFTEVFLDRGGARTEPYFELAGVSTSEPLPLGEGDVVLVTGGGKGIGAECALQLARRTGCRLLVLGRSPHDDPELAANIERFRHAGVRVSYRMVDVTDAAAVKSAVAKGVEELGAPVTGVVHGAGANDPRLVADLSSAAAAATLAPKVEGLRNVLGAVGADRLRLLVAFGSIIARIGLRGEADYALANEWLSHEIEAFQALHPACRCRSIEWSVWSGTGMGQRLGRLEALARQGVAPLSIDDGIREFQRLVDAPGGPVSVVVTGRFGAFGAAGAPGAAGDPPAIDKLRFIETVRVFYPGVELVADCRLSRESDPYLDDHMLGEERLLPAVMALEAMAEATACVLGASTSVAGASPAFRDVRFKRAVVAGRDAEAVTVRVAALVQPNGEVSLAIRASTTGFRLNHVEATAVPEPVAGPAAPVVAGRRAALAAAGPGSPEPARALYRTVLFQTGRFERVAAYRTVAARRCEANLSADGALDWFSGPGAGSRMLLGDPGARDGALHAIQACIPHRVVIPTAVGVIETGALDPSHGYSMAASEVADRGDELVYELAIHDRRGQVVERWRNVMLRVVGEPPHFCLDSPALTGPFLERCIAAVDPAAGVQVALVPAGDGRSRPGHRPDGKPDPSGDGRLRSVAYDRDWKLEVRAAVPVGGDLESVEARSPDRWTALLGASRFELAQVVAALVKERGDVSATRVWTAMEALKKAGAPPAAPLVVDPDSSSRWTVFRSGTATVFSSAVVPHGPEPARCVAIALRPNDDDPSRARPRRGPPARAGRSSDNLVASPEEVAKAAPVRGLLVAPVAAQPSPTTTPA